MVAVKYAEGDYFSLPLLDDGFVTGLVARANPKGVVLCYFFGPKRTTKALLIEVQDLASSDAILIRKCGHLGLEEGRWEILGQVPHWDRSQWAVPAFGRYEELTGRSYKIFYDDHDPTTTVRRELVADRSRLEGLPSDDLFGDMAAQMVLTKLLETVWKITAPQWLNSPREGLVIA